MKFWRQIELTRDDIRGAVTITVVLILVVLIVALNKDRDSDKVSKELNSIETPTKNSEILHTAEMHKFDPNTVELRELLQMGFTKQQSLSLLRYRASGKVFNIKEELIECYGFSDSIYFAIEQYIEIGDEFKYKPKRKESNNTKSRTEQQEEISVKRELLTPSKFLIDTVGIEYLVAIGALTTRQAEVFVRWRNLSGIENLEQLKECYTVSDSTANWLAEYAIFTPKVEHKSTTKESKKLININQADSAELISIYGVGAKSAAAIIEYREKLGGFHSKEQLSEIKIITESNFEKIIKQISINNSDISKIDVNFATAKQLGRHPYFTSLKIRRLLKIRELKGGWRTIEEMIEDNIFTKEEAQRVHPYLHFEVQDPI